MALTTEERRRLCTLADQLAPENPRLARALAGRRYRRRIAATSIRRLLRGRRRVLLDWLAIVLLAGAPVLLTVGAALGSTLLLGAGSAALLSGPIICVIHRSGRAAGPTRGSRPEATA